MKLAVFVVNLPLYLHCDFFFFFVWNLVTGRTGARMCGGYACLPARRGHSWNSFGARKVALLPLPRPRSEDYPVAHLRTGPEAHDSAPLDCRPP